MKNWCVQFLNNVMQGQKATEDQKAKFTESINAAHVEGLYLAFGKTRGWFLSDKKPEKLQEQKDNLHHLINSLFERVD